MDHRKITFYNIASAGLMILTFTGFATTLAVMPCQVHNILIQPRFGISANTRELIEIVQAPPHLIQTIQVGICKQNNYTFTDQDPSPKNLPSQICRQRYTSVEVYSKLSQEKMESLRSIRNILKLTKDDQQFGESFIKDFVLVEAGCDIYFNYLPPLSSSAGSGGGNVQRPIFGISDINSPRMEDTPRGARQPQQPSQPTPYPKYDILQVAAPSDFKQSSLKSRSMIRDDFFRKGLHFEGLKGGINNREVNNANSSKRPSPSPDRETDNEGLDQSEDGVRAASNDGDDIDERNSTTGPKIGENPDTESFSPAGAMREQELKSEDIGLPVLFLDPEFDPVMKLIKMN